MAARKKVLTDKIQTTESDLQPLTKVPTLPFKMSIEHNLDNNYQIKDMSQRGIKDLHHFIDETIGKGLSISQVEAMYLRTRGLAKSLIRQTVNGIERDILHFGKDRQPLRVFGYYSSQYFVITKIDCNHETHK
jgi:hypothetical protein